MARKKLSIGVQIVQLFAQLVIERPTAAGLVFDLLKQKIEWNIRSLEHRNPPQAKTPRAKKQKPPDPPLRPLPREP